MYNVTKKFGISGMQYHLNGAQHINGWRNQETTHDKDLTPRFNKGEIDGSEDENKY